MAQNNTQMPGAERDEETGEYRETYPEDKFVETLREIGPAGTQDVADGVGCSYDHAYKKLRSFEEGGVVTSSRVGNARLWELTDDEEGGG